MKPTPAGWPRISSGLYYRDPARMIDWLCEAFGPKTRFGTEMRSPLSTGCNTQGLMLYVDDVDAHCARVRAAGARIVDEPSLHDYGEAYWADRSYGAANPEGHLWWFSERVRNPGTA
jgi:uncharacterized glyoxalase superfamily protein PhnB